MARNNRNELVERPEEIDSVDIEISTSTDPKQGYIALLSNGSNIRFESKNDKTAKYRAYRIAKDHEDGPFKLVGLKRINR